MRKFIICLVVLTSINAFGQFGIRGGLNYGATGGLSTDNIESRIDSFDVEDEVGYHAGIFVKINLVRNFLSVQPELLYTSLNSSYSFENDNGVNTFEYEIDKVDLPVLLQMKVLGPLYIKAGPSFQYILSNDSEEFDFEDPTSNISAGYQAGIGLLFGNFGIDVRYEGAFGDNTADEANDAAESLNLRVDSRPSQFILSASISLGKSQRKKKKEREAAEALEDE